jgi:hypothetical protein
LLSAAAYAVLCIRTLTCDIYASRGSHGSQARVEYEAMCKRFAMQPNAELLDSVTKVSDTAKVTFSEGFLYEILMTKQAPADLKAAIDRHMKDIRVSRTPADRIHPALWAKVTAVRGSPGPP